MDNSDFDFGQGKHIPKTVEQFHSQIRSGYTQDLARNRRRLDKPGQSHRTRLQAELVS